MKADKFVIEMCRVYAYLKKRALESDREATRLKGLIIPSVKGRYQSIAYAGKAIGYGVSAQAVKSAIQRKIKEG